MRWSTTSGRPPSPVRLEPAEEVVDAMRCGSSVGLTSEAYRATISSCRSRALLYVPAGRWEEADAALAPGEPTGRHEPSRLALAPDRTRAPARETSSWSTGTCPSSARTRLRPMSRSGSFRWPRSRCRARFLRAIWTRRVAVSRRSSLALRPDRLIRRRFALPIVRVARRARVMRDGSRARLRELRAAGRRGAAGSSDVADGLLARLDGDPETCATR